MDTFNPTMVWFYLVFCSRYYSLWKIKYFQSHYGLILSERRARRGVGSDNFQSHYGLILSSIASDIPLAAALAFNPTMVWFYPVSSPHDVVSFTSLSIPLWSDFISAAFPRPWERSRAFNPTIGLILSRGLYRICSGTFLPFNPTMVWFYPEIVKYAEKAGMDAFNPTMVWFYPARFERAGGQVRELSIPLWSDFIAIEFRISVFPTPNFQSHYGLILSYRTISLKIFSVIRLSIPLWSDFIFIYTSLHVCGKSPFNPTMVWFYLI